MHFKPFYALRELGLVPLARYAVYQLELRSGWLRWRTPTFAWEKRPLEMWLRSHIPSDPAGYTQYCGTRTQPFFFQDVGRLGVSLKAILGDDIDTLVAEADSVLDGRYRLFGQPELALGNPPNWSAFALTPSDSENFPLWLGVFIGSSLCADGRRSLRRWFLCPFAFLAGSKCPKQRLELELGSGDSHPFARAGVFVLRLQSRASGARR